MSADKKRAMRALHQHANECSFSVTAEIEASEFFEDENRTWKWCCDNATFHHADSGACEFILHCGRFGDGYADRKVEQMILGGCSAEFMAAYLTACAQGAMRVLFYV